MTRRRMVAVVLSVLGFFAVAWRTARSAAPPENATDEILKVDEERNQALQKNDIATLDRIYSDDLVYANTNGILLTKAQHLADLQKRTLNFKSFKHDDVQGGRARRHRHPDGNQHVRRGLPRKRLEQPSKIPEHFFQEGWALALCGAL